MAILTPYTEQVSHELSKALARTGPYAMYGMMRYFVGLADESFLPSETYGGKRFRSALLLLVADAYGAREQGVSAALSVELFHNFTLIHDDIVDKDVLRRGRPTVWKLWGIPHAINAGDAQLLLAYRALSDGAAAHPSRGLPLQQFFTEKYLEVSEGQFLDFTLTEASLADSAVTLECYFEMIQKKTAVLVGAAAKGGGIMAGVSISECEQLYTYGVALGLAVQLRDDAMSIWGESMQTGKEVYGDIKERKKTLPVLYARDTLTGSARARFIELYTENIPLTDAEVTEIVALLDSIGTREYVEVSIGRELKRAAVAVDALSCATEFKDMLRALPGECMPR